MTNMMNVLEVDNDTIIIDDDSEHDIMASIEERKSQQQQQQQQSPISFYFHSSPSSKSNNNNIKTTSPNNSNSITTSSSMNGHHNSPLKDDKTYRSSTNGSSSSIRSLTINRNIQQQQKQRRQQKMTTFLDDCESGISMNCRCRKASLMLAFMVAIIVTFYSNISLVIKLGSAQYNSSNNPLFLSTDEAFHNLQQMMHGNVDNSKKSSRAAGTNVGDDDDPLESTTDDASGDDSEGETVTDDGTPLDTLESPQNGATAKSPSSPRKRSMNNNNGKNNKNMGRIQKTNTGNQKQQQRKRNGIGSQQQQKKKINARTTIQDIVPTKQSLSSNASLSACLLIKDDNEILSEWIAYHYHTITLRHLIVAVDPLSFESPTSILAKWKLLTDLNIRLWHDEDYMPDEFIETGQAPPNFIARETDLKNSKMRQESIIEISNHRYRQRVFLASCLREMRAEGNSWVIHIDTDEYVVPSKLLRQMKPRYIQIPPMEQPGSVLSLLQQVTEKTTRNVNYPCISMLRVLYGSVESSIEEQSVGVPVEYNATKFESLRWRYHALPHHAELHGNPKVILDVQAIPEKYFDETIVFSIHRPVRQYCPKNSDLAFSNFRKQPIAVNHYLGSWERYSGRNDKRRSRDKYDLKASMNRGHDDGLRMWLQGFVTTMGHETAKKLLGDQYLSNYDDSMYTNITLPITTSTTEEV